MCVRKSGAGAVLGCGFTIKVGISLLRSWALVQMDG